MSPPRGLSRGSHRAPVPPVCWGHPERDSAGGAGLCPRRVPGAAPCLSFAPVTSQGPCAAPGDVPNPASCPRDGNERLSPPLGPPQAPPDPVLGPSHPGKPHRDPPNLPEGPWVAVPTPARTIVTAGDSGDSGHCPTQGVSANSTPKPALEWHRRDPIATLALHTPLVIVTAGSLPGAAGGDSGVLRGHSGLGGAEGGFGDRGAGGEVAFGDRGRAVVSPGQDTLGWDRLVRVSRGVTAPQCHPPAVPTGTRL